ncbi:capsule assembly Wzi family protein [Cyclobacterium amurskyense]|nr:capsule assembly Wzi family protein [Cyclobacterium amurskyense]|tara:strand:+ start:2433 stop:4106 length:1674 start_codon:yes stop_codon:yes gene_type:complete
MKDQLQWWLIILLFFSSTIAVFPQNMAPGTPVLEEYGRREQLLSNSLDSLKPQGFRPDLSIKALFAKPEENTQKVYGFSVLPVQSKIQYNSKRPYGYGGYGMHNGRGYEQYLSAGLYGYLGFLHLQLQPEFVYSQNKSYQGFSSDFPIEVLVDRFHFWNRNDRPELLAKGNSNSLWWGQSSLTAKFGGFETGISTRSIWWGPGQWNSLTFSGNAESFPHLTLNSHRPLKTFLGHFEGQLIVGRLESSGMAASQNDGLNERFFLPLDEDWRYLNAIMINYQPKWVPGLFLGFSRTFQQYNDKRGTQFRDYMPIFDAFQKEKFFDDGNSVAFDSEARDQQATLFMRFVNKKAKIEIYGEYGRRDHALNWRDAILNPEHSRAYLMGFQKLVTLAKQNTYLQIRSEILHQQESVNRYIRYLGLGGRTSWATHYQVRGFTNRGKALGSGIGTGSNSQTFEVSVVEGFNKLGIMVERIANHQDFYYRAFGQDEKTLPWVDFTLGVLADRQWNNFLVGSQFQLVNGKNYQWQSDPLSTSAFPKNKSMLSFHGRIHLVYLWGGIK